MAKGIREKIKLVSSAGTGHFYTTTKNKRTKPRTLSCKKLPCLWIQRYQLIKRGVNDIQLHMGGNLEDKHDFAVGIKVVLQYLPDCFNLSVLAVP